MAEITVKNITKDKEWENFLSRHPEVNFLQSWSWGDFHQALGHKIYRTGFYEASKLVGVMLSIVEEAKRGKYLTVPGGPIIDWQNSNQVRTFTEKIKEIANADKCVFVRVRPQLESNDLAKTIFAKYGFVSAPMHLHAELTSQLDISDSEDLLAQMRKTTRYEIKEALALGIKVTAINKASSIKDFYDLQVLTSKRQGFVPFSYEYLYQQFKVFAKAGQALLYSAQFKGKLLAQALIIFYGQEAAYHYGASTEEGRQYPGAYLIQWQVIKEAQRRGMKRYNFWGVAPADNSEHRFYGVSIFKRGFGGKDVNYLHAQDLIINQPKYVLNFLVESLRKRFRGV